MLFFKSQNLKKFNSLADIELFYPNHKIIVIENSLFTHNIIQLKNGKDFFCITATDSLYDSLISENLGD